MKKKTNLKTWLVISVVLVVSSAQAGPFPSAPGDDSFSSAGVFKVTLSPALGGSTMVIWVSGPTCVAHSAPHPQVAGPAFPSSSLGDGSTCIGSPSAGTSDIEIGYFPPGYEAGAGADEVHNRDSRYVFDQQRRLEHHHRYLGNGSMSTPQKPR